MSAPKNEDLEILTAAVTDLRDAKKPNSDWIGWVD
jgi:hypothetical protein